MRYSQYRQQNHHVLISQTALANFSDRLFDQQADDASSTCSQGRGQVVCFEHDNQQLVLKRYHRGGILSRLIKDSYIYSGAARSRMWQEFKLLAQLRSLGLPVPRPVAARCVKSSAMSYQGELIMERLLEVRTLAEILCQQTLPEKTWEALGQVIRRFHENNVDHADLNACNILINDHGQIYLIDFDKGRIHQKQNKARCHANLSRLRRSLMKWQQRSDTFHFEPHHWGALQRGYQGAGTRSVPLRTAAPTADIAR